MIQDLLDPNTLPAFPHFDSDVTTYLILRSQSRYQVVTNRVTTALFLN